MPGRRTQRGVGMWGACTPSGSQSAAHCWHRCARGCQWPAALPVLGSNCAGWAMRNVGCKGGAHAAAGAGAAWRAPHLLLRAALRQAQVLADRRRCMVEAHEGAHEQLMRKCSWIARLFQARQHSVCTAGAGKQARHGLFHAQGFFVQPSDHRHRDPGRAMAFGHACAGRDAGAYISLGGRCGCAMLRPCYWLRCIVAIYVDGTTAAAAEEGHAGGIRSATAAGS